MIALRPFRPRLRSTLLILAGAGTLACGLAVDCEPVIVGEAARGFTFTWRIPVPLAPSLAESRAFVSEYEVARGAPFTAAERETAGAAAVYALAYTARCEHCLGSRTTGNALDALATHGEELFGI